MSSYFEAAIASLGLLFGWVFCVFNGTLDIGSSFAFDTLMFAIGTPIYLAAYALYCILWNQHGSARCPRLQSR